MDTFKKRPSNKHGIFLQEKGHRQVDFWVQQLSSQIFWKKWGSNEIETWNWKNSIIWKKVKISLENETNYYLMLLYFYLI